MRPSEASYQLVKEDCFEWMEHCPAHSVHAIVTESRDVRPPARSRSTWFP